MPLFFLERVISMPRTILIVEDNDLCRKALGIAFGNLPGLQVHIVETAEQALDCLAVDHFCALVTELHLPEMDGFALIETVRSQSRHGQLPILAISGDGDPYTLTRVRDLGANGYLQKPYSPSDVRAKLTPLLRTPHSE